MKLKTNGTTGFSKISQLTDDEARVIRYALFRLMRETMPIVRPRHSSLARDLWSQMSEQEFGN